MNLPFQYGLLRRFCIAWVLYWIVYLIQPTHSLYPDIVAAWGLQFLFVLTLCISYLIISIGFVGIAGMSLTPISSIDFNKANKIIQWGLLASLIGFLLLLYDKIFIQGIDYSQGLASAREQWRIIGEQREGAASSLFSALGYVLGGTYFLSLALTLSRFVNLGDSRRFLYLLLGGVILGLHSLITGGRSSILLAIAVISFGFFSSKHDRFPPLFNRIHFKTFIWAFSAIIFSYVVYVFYSRAATTETGISEYSLDFLEHLGLQPYAWFVDVCKSSTIGGMLAVLNLTSSYLTHSLATTAAIVQYSGWESDGVIFSHLISLSSKLGLSEPPMDWFLAGRAPSLPGALYLQFGLMGMLFGAFLLGTLSSIFEALLFCRPDSLVLFFICTIIESILITSPFLFVGDLLFFPFMVIGGGALIVFSRFFRRSNA